jgi:pilus assembly protein CpaE
MTVLYEPVPAEAQRLNALLGGVHTVTTIEDLHTILAEDREELLVVIGAGTDRIEALRFAQRMRVSRPALGVVLLRMSVDADLLAEALRAGVREVVDGQNPVAIREACARSLELSQQLRKAASAVGDTHHSTPHTDGTVVTVFGAKGGSGKTTITSNLAIALAAGGANRVLLIDLDLAFGDVAIMLQLVPERTIVDAVAMADRLDETGLRSLLTPYGPGLDTLLAPPGPTDGDRINRALVGELIRLASTMFDYVVIDTPPAFTDQVLAAMDATHQYVLVTAPDIPTLKNLRVTLDMFDLLGYPQERRLVVLNRSDTRVGLTMADIQRVIRTPIAAHVPSSRDVPVSVNRGIPLMVDNPGHPLSKAVRELAETKLGAVVTPVAKQPAGRRRLLSARKGG